MFRRYQFAFLVGFGCLLMFSFIIAPPLQEYLRSRANEGANPLVVSYSGGKVRVADLTRLRANHARSHEVLRKLFLETQRKGGFPKAQELPRYSADQDLLEIVFLAAKARKMGMQVTDNAINEFLADWTDQTVGGDDIVQAIRDADLSQAGFFEQLRTEMLARNLRVLANGGSIVVTPAALWNNFNRINRKVTAQVLPIAVADSIDQVSGEPSETELKELFAEYKERLPNPNFAEPGFALPYRAAFSYVTADYDQFLARAKTQVTDEEIEAEYQRRVDQGQYRRLLPLPDQLSPSDRPPAPQAPPSRRRSSRPPRRPRPSRQPRIPGKIRRKTQPKTLNPPRTKRPPRATPPRPRRRTGIQRPRQQRIRRPKRRLHPRATAIRLQATAIRLQATAIRLQATAINRRRFKAILPSSLSGCKTHKTRRPLRNSRRRTTRQPSRRRTRRNRPKRRPPHPAPRRIPQRRKLPQRALRRLRRRPPTRRLGTGINRARTRSLRKMNAKSFLWARFAIKSLIRSHPPKRSP